jgi:hypothetical protein
MYGIGCYVKETVARHWRVSHVIVFSGPPQQITVMEHRLFGHIDLIEFKGCAWMKARQGTDTEKCVPPVVAMEELGIVPLRGQLRNRFFFRIASRFCASGETPTGFEWRQDDILSRKQ